MSVSPLFLFSCEKESSVEPRTAVFYEYFDTVSTVYSYRDETLEEFNAHTETIKEILNKYHRLCDIYYEYSGMNNLKTVNDKAGIAPVKVDAELIEFMEYANEIFSLTRGETNIAMGPVLKLWHDKREEASEGVATLPNNSDLSEAAKHSSQELLVIDKENSTLYLSDPLGRIDVGALAKGYATEMAAQYLIENGISSYVLDIGGNLRIVGKKENGEGWITGITDPDKSSGNSFAMRLRLYDTSCVTSGNYERYFTVGSKKYHHIIDKDTLYPANYFASVSIITKDSALADALSTALFCMPYEEGLQLVKSLGGVDAIWIYEDGSVKYTDGIIPIMVDKQ